MIVVTLQHPTPYYDDSYAVNSVNNGPYGDALSERDDSVSRGAFPNDSEAVRASVDRRIDGRMGIAGGASVLSGFFRRNMDAVSGLD